ncbi:uncharacterized protein [Argopecten irradians]
MQHANASKAKCEEDDGTLAYIPNEAALTKISDFLDSRLSGGWDFIYLGYQTSAKREIVIQGTTIVHSWMEWDIAHDQPNNNPGWCISIFTDTWKVHDTDCSVEMYALCSTPYVIDTTTNVSTASTAAFTTNLTTTTTTTSATNTSSTTMSSTSISSTIITTTTTTTLSCCNCHTAFIITEVNITEELQEQLDTLKKETKVDEENLSSTIRKKTSASDPRPSSAYVGYLGIGLLTVIFGGLFLLDLPSVVMWLKSFQ